MFANRKYEELSYPNNPKICDPILVTLLKMRPHYSQSSRQNATPSSCTSPLVSYKEVPSPPPPRATRILLVHQSSPNIKRKLLVIQHQWKMVIETLDDTFNKDMRRINIVLA